MSKSVLKADKETSPSENTPALNIQYSTKKTEKTNRDKLHSQTSTNSLKLT